MTSNVNNNSLNTFENLSVYAIAVGFVLLIAAAIGCFMYGLGLYAMNSVSDSIYASTGRIVNLAPLANAIAFLATSFFFAVVCRKR